ncbi:hypothetical protein H072_3905 [Dactylellina haptotyla CBS 200.50]|uniref:Rrn9 domain-containing protein n=1 Tax=Dactylellina haptotyla (strain CBS 200.50) TaxID=1284197 RepID=S8ALT6_DACHA|nr:hypothetical protein H072_3905 [Dactylellina haptotyla CBS 200.50]
MSSQGRQSRSASLMASRQSTNDLEDDRRTVNDRGFLEEQIKLLKSLDDRSREDLSQHLHFIYHLNQFYLGRSRVSNVESGSAQGSEGAKEIEANRRKSVVPSLKHRWRAWPLPVQQTPRLDLGVSPSDSLCEYLTSVMLRSAFAQTKLRENPQIFSADDELSAKICVPAIEHIKSSLDRLLIGIYRSREGYAAKEDPQAIDTIFRKRRHRFTESNIDAGPGPNDAIAAKKQRMDTNHSGDHLITQIYRQGSQQLLSATDVLQHAMLQSFPRKVLERTNERLESILWQPLGGGDGEHGKYLTLIEDKRGSAYFGSLTADGTTSVDGLEPVANAFLETDSRRVQIGDKQINRSMWEALDENQVQVAEAGCFDRDGFLEEIPGPGRTKESRRRNYKAKKRQELETRHA